jgi:hypothetical protein
MKNGLEPKSVNYVVLRKWFLIVLADKMYGCVNIPAKIVKEIIFTKQFTSYDKFTNVS